MGVGIDQVYSMISDTNVLNTGKKSDFSKRLVDFYRHHYDRKVHSLECLYYIHEIYFTYVIAKVEGKTKGQRATQNGAMMKNFKDIQKPDLSKIISREKLKISITKIGALYLIKAEWFSSKIKTTKKG